MKKASKLRRRAKELAELGEYELAAQMAARADALDGIRPSTRAKTATPSLPKNVVLFKEDGRIFIQPPPMDNPRKTRALAMNLREAAKVVNLPDGSPTAKWEGREYEKGDPKRGLWSFADVPVLMVKIRKVLGDFFSEAKLVSPEGEVLGTLPKSTYSK